MMTSESIHFFTFSVEMDNLMDKKSLSINYMQFTGCLQMQTLN